LMGSAVKVKVYIDGILVKELSNGEYFESILDNGKHILHFERVGLPSTLFMFTGDDNEIAYFMELPFTWTKTATPLIVKKVKETEPGTLRKMKDFKL